MSAELTISEADATTMEPSSTLADFSTESTTWVPEAKSAFTTVSSMEFPVNESVNNLNGSIADSQQSPSESQDALFEAFIIIEIVMTALELILSVLAASKVARWRRNFRNQMLMQFSLVRFLKRVYSWIEFLERNKRISGEILSVVSYGVQFYIDFVIVILVCFFIKHMYDSLIVVVVKINRNQLLKVTLCSWVVPLPLSALGAGLVYCNVVSHVVLYVFICGAFKWPLMLIGTIIYLVILFRVVFDKIRQFAKSLTIITFLLCLVLNLHLFCKDVIWLWCIDSFTTNIASYLLGFIMNVLVLSLYIVLITLHLKCKKTQNCDNPFYSDYVTKC